MSVEQLLSKFDTLEFKQLHVVIKAAVQRKTDFPGTGVDIRARMSTPVPGKSVFRCTAALMTTCSCLNSSVSNLLRSCSTDICERVQTATTSSNWSAASGQLMDGPGTADGVLNCAGCLRQRSGMLLLRGLCRFLQALVNQSRAGGAGFR